MNILTEGRKALISKLSTITVANGYRTAAGPNVKSGWFNEIIKAKDAAYPLIVVQKSRGQPPVAGPLALKVFTGFDVIGAVEAGLNDYEDVIEDLEHDLIQCLMPKMAEAPDWLPRGVPAISLGAPQHFPPADGLVAATVLIPVYLHTIIQELRHGR
jgi:hypothetical protein